MRCRDSWREASAESSPAAAAGTTAPGSGAAPFQWLRGSGNSLDTGGEEDRSKEIKRREELGTEKSLSSFFPLDNTSESNLN